MEICSTGTFHGNNWWIDILSFRDFSILENSSELKLEQLPMIRLLRTNEWRWWIQRSAYGHKYQRTLNPIQTVRKVRTMGKECQISMQNIKYHLKSHSHRWSWNPKFSLPHGRRTLFSFRMIEKNERRRNSIVARRSLHHRSRQWHRRTCQVEYDIRNSNQKNPTDWLTCTCNCKCWDRQSESPKCRIYSATNRGGAEVAIYK